jgi:hypothetical protein
MNGHDVGHVLAEVTEVGIGPVLMLALFNVKATVKA